VNISNKELRAELNSDNVKLHDKIESSCRELRKDSNANNLKLQMKIEASNEELRNNSMEARISQVQKTVKIRL
jgi:hypothetical protein